MTLKKQLKSAPDTLTRDSGQNGKFTIFTDQQFSKLSEQCKVKVKQAQNGNLTLLADIGYDIIHGTNGFSKNEEIGKKCILYSSSHDNGQGKALHGIMMYDGDCLNRNTIGAVKILEEAASDYNNSLAKLKLAKIEMANRRIHTFSRQSDIDVNYVLAKNYARDAADDNLPDGIFLYGCLSEKKKSNKYGSIEPDFNEAFRCFKLAADSGNPDACANLGEYYTNSKISVQPDFKEAVRLFKIAKDKGSLKGKAFYGMMLIYGRGIKKNEKEGIKLLKEAFDAGDPSALQIYAGLLSIGVPGYLKPDSEKSAYYLEASASKGDPNGMMYYGLCREKGRGRKKDVRDAIEYYELAVQEGNVLAAELLGKLLYNGDEDQKLEKNSKEANKYLKFAIDNGLKGGISIYANNLIIGDGIEQDIPEGLRLLQIGIDNNDPKSMVVYAGLLFEGKYVTKNDEKGIELIKAAVALYDPDALFAYGQLYEQGVIIPKDLGEAIVLYEKAAKLGNKKAEERYEALQKAASGSLHLKIARDLLHDQYSNFGMGGQNDINYVEAKKEAKLSADAGNSDGMVLYAQLCEKEKTNSFGSITRNFKEAFEYYKIAADYENYEALTNYGRFLSLGRGCDCNQCEANEFYKMAAENGNLTAKALLGMSLILSDGIRKNENEGRKLLEESAKGKNPTGMNLLGYLYSVGEGGYSVDFNKAVSLFLEAAELGSADAMNNYGVCLHYGEGVKQNIQEATAYYKQALSEGCSLAGINLGLLHINGEENAGYEPNAKEGNKYLKAGAEAGNGICLYEYAYSLAYSRGETENMSEAVKYAQKGADLLNLGCLCLFGALQMDGIGIEKNFEEGGLCIKKAALFDDKWANDLLEELAEHYEGEVTDIFKKFSTYTPSMLNNRKELRYERYAKYQESIMNYKLANEMMNNSFYRIPHKYRPSNGTSSGGGNSTYDPTQHLQIYGQSSIRFADIKRSFKISADSGNPTAMVQYAHMCEKEKSNSYGKIHQDFKEAFKYFEMASKWDEPEGTAFVGRYYEIGNGAVPIDFAKAIEYYQKAIEQNSDYGRAFYGKCLINGVGIDKNEEEGNSVLDKTYKNRNSYGVNAYAETQLTKPDTDKKEISQLYKQAAESDPLCPCAVNNFAYCLQNGIGLIKHIEHAIEYYKFAISEGCIAAARNLGILLLKGDPESNLEPNIEEANRYLKQAVDCDDPIAIYEYANNLINGIGVPKDPKLAAELLLRGVNAKNPLCMRLYGQLLITGNGVNKNPEEGARLIKEAADLGDPIACQMYGYLLENGIGVPKNLEEALKYYKKAAESGDPEAQQKYDELMKKKESGDTAKEAQQENPISPVPTTNQSACCLLI